MIVRGKSRFRRSSLKTASIFRFRMPVLCRQRVPGEQPGNGRIREAWNSAELATVVTTSPVSITPNSVNGEYYFGDSQQRLFLRESSTDRFVGTIKGQKRARDVCALQPQPSRSLRTTEPGSAEQGSAWRLTRISSLKYYRGNLDPRRQMSADLIILQPSPALPVGISTTATTSADPLRRILFSTVPQVGCKPLPAEQARFNSVSARGAPWLREGEQRAADLRGLYADYG
jgi:hypothetical protein